MDDLREIVARALFDDDNRLGFMRRWEQVDPPSRARFYSGADAVLAALRAAGCLAGARLTDAEREALLMAADWFDGKARDEYAVGLDGASERFKAHAAFFRSLVERTES